MRKPSQAPLAKVFLFIPLFPITFLVIQAYNEYRTINPGKNMAMSLNGFLENFAKRYRENPYPHPDEIPRNTIDGKPVDDDIYYQKIGELVDEFPIGGGGIRRG